MAFPKININTETVTVEKYWLGVNSRVSRQMLAELAHRHQDHVLKQATITQELSPVMDEMFIYLRTFLLKSMQEEKVTLTVTVPATWFDHLKQHWLESGVSWKMRLARGLSQPKFVTETKECKVVRVCPHNDSYLSENTQHLHWLMWKDNFRSGGHYDAS